MRRCATFLSIALTLSLVLSCGASAQALDRLTVSEVTHSVFYSPQYVAMALGFFEEEGLEVELINGQGADKVMTAVISGQVQIGLAGPESCIYVAAQGKEDHGVIFAQLTKRDGSFLVGRTPEAFAWENLRGKYVIGGRTGGVPAMTLNYVLKQNGLTPGTDLTVDNTVQFALMAGAFTGGTGDYVTLFEPVASLLEKEGKGYILASIGEMSGEIPYTAYFAAKSYIEAHPDIIQRFTNAVYKGQKWCLSHTAREIAEVVAPQFPDTDIDLLTTVTQRHIDIDAWNATPVMLPESFDRLQDVIREAGELPEDADFATLVNNTFAEQAVLAAP